MEAKLIVIGGKANKSEVKLKLPTTIGRSRSADLTVAHPKVSRHHCQILEREGVLVVRDNGSLNGTYIDNERITEAILKPGDKLTVGPLTFVAVYEHSGKFPSEVPAGEAHVARLTPEGAEPGLETPEIKPVRAHAPAAVESPDFAEDFEPEFAADLDLPAEEPPWKATAATSSSSPSIPPQLDNGAASAAGPAGETTDMSWLEEPAAAPGETVSDAPADALHLPQPSDVTVGAPSPTITLAPAAERFSDPPLDMGETLPDAIEVEEAAALVSAEEGPATIDFDPPAAADRPRPAAPVEDLKWLDDAEAAAEAAKPVADDAEPAAEDAVPSTEMLKLGVEEPAQPAAALPQSASGQPSSPIDATVQFQAPPTDTGSDEDAAAADLAFELNVQTEDAAPADADRSAADDSLDSPTLSGRSATEDEESSLPAISISASAKPTAARKPPPAAKPSPAADDHIAGTPSSLGKDAKAKKGWWPFGGKAKASKKPAASQPVPHHNGDDAAVEQEAPSAAAAAASRPAPVTVHEPKAAPVADDSPPFFAVPAADDATTTPAASNDDELNEFFKSLK